MARGSKVKSAFFMDGRFLVFALASSISWGKAIDQCLMHRFTHEPRSFFAHSPNCCVVGFIEPHTNGFLAQWFLPLWHLVLMLLQVLNRAHL